MTREKAIEMLKYIRYTGNGESEYKNCAQSVAIDMAIKVLEQQPCEDAVSRQDVLSEVKSGMIRTIDGENWKRVNDNVRDIQALPPVTSQRKIGRWKKMVSVYDVIEGKYRMMPYTHADEEVNNPPFYVCDCGNNSKKPTNYCPDCGNKMIEITVRIDEIR